MCDSLCIRLCNRLSECVTLTYEGLVVVFKILCSTDGEC